MTQPGNWCAAQGSGGGDFRYCDLQRWFGFVAFRYRAGTGLSRTMKFSVLVINRGLTNGIEIDVAGRTAWAPAISRAAVRGRDAVLVERHDEGSTDITFSMGEFRRR
jgi:hypothetical protein